MANTIQLKRSSVVGKVPDSANVEIGEPVVNLADKILYTKDGSGTVIVVGAGQTSNIAEGSNLYFTNARAYANVVAAGFYDTVSNTAPIGATEAGTTLSLSHLDSGVVAATYGNATLIPVITVNASGHVTSVSNVAITAGAASSGSNVTVSSTPPSSNSSGDVWVDTGNAIQYTYIDDGNSSQWVELGPVEDTTFIVGAPFTDTYTANGTGTTFVLSAIAPSANTLFVWVDGVIQSPTTNYTVSGNVLTFTSSPSNNAAIDVKYFVGDSRYNVTLGQIYDVSNTTPITNQALIWNGSQWAPGNVSTSANVISVAGATGIVSNAQLKAGIENTSSVLDQTVIFSLLLSGI